MDIRKKIQSLFKTISPWEAFITGVVTSLPGIYSWVREFFGINMPPIPTAGISLIAFIICLLVIFILKVWALEKQLEPNIELTEPIVWTEPKNALDQNLKSYKTYRLRVKNIGSELIRDCQVKLIDMFNINNEPTREDGVVFKLKNDNPQNPFIFRVLIYRFRRFY